MELPKEGVEILQIAPLEGEEILQNNFLLGEGCVPIEIGEEKNENDDESSNNEILVAPVELAGGVPLEGMTFMGTPLAAHLSKTQAAPKFSNKKEDWSEFLWKFESWIRVMATGRKLADSEMLQLFNSCLPTNLQRELQLWENRFKSSVKYCSLCWKVCTQEEGKEVRRTLVCVNRFPRFS